MVLGVTTPTPPAGPSPKPGPPGSTPTTAKAPAGTRGGALPGKAPTKGGLAGKGVSGAAATGSNALGKLGGAAAAAKALTDPDTSTKDKAVAAATTAATAAVSAVASPLAGKVAGTLLQSKAGRRALAAVASVLVMLLIAVVGSVASAVQAAAMLIVAAADAGDGGGGDQCKALGADASLNPEQQANAAAIIATVTARGLGAEDAAIAIMTALTESTLSNVDHGDIAGPDSRGLFQQRDSWGPIEVRMDPAGATGLFLDRLTSPALSMYRASNVMINATPSSRSGYMPWMAAQSVQISAFALGDNYKAKYVQAVSIVTNILGSAPANAQGWADSAGLSLTSASAVPAAVDVTAVEGAPVIPATTTTGCGAIPIGVFDGTGTPNAAAPGAWGGFDNGKIPDAAMAPIPWAPTQPLEPNAAAALIALNARYKAVFGTDIAVADGYRTFDQQVALKLEKPVLAGVPGTSNHGWAKALDLGDGINNWGTTKRNWMVANAPGFGWVSPGWANPGGQKLEPWHWEFNGIVGMAAA